MTTLVAPSTVTSMYDIAEELLEAVTAAMATTSGGAPAASYITLGEPAFITECSQAVVQIPTLGEEITNVTSPAGNTGLRHIRGRMNLVGLTAYAIRCFQISEQNMQNYMPPSPATESSEAKQGYEDGWAIWNYVNRAIDTQGLFGGSCTVAHMVGGTPYQPAGGLAGWRFALRVELAGYNPTGS